MAVEDIDLTRGLATVRRGKGGKPTTEAVFLFTDYLRPGHVPGLFHAKRGKPMTLTPSERTLRAQIAAHESWAKTSDRTARTAAARQAMLDKFEKQVDPNNELTQAERAKRAENARKAHYQRMALKSARHVAAVALRRPIPAGDREIPIWAFGKPAWNARPPECNSHVLAKIINSPGG